MHKYHVISKNIIIFIIIITLGGYNSTLLIVGTLEKNWIISFAVSFNEVGIHRLNIIFVSPNGSAGHGPSFDVVCRFRTVASKSDSCKS